MHEKRKKSRSGPNLTSIFSSSCSSLWAVYCRENPSRAFLSVSSYLPSPYLFRREERKSKRLASQGLWAVWNWTAEVVRRPWH